MRVNVMPGARIFMIVTMKLRPVIVELMPTRKIARHQSDVPGGPCSEIGGYSVQPGIRRADEERREQDQRRQIGNIQKLTRLSHGNATSRAPICSGIT